MINILPYFFQERFQKGLPLLLAFSGGPDSLALLHLLLEFSQSQPLSLALAHVDHGWREESAKEADQIACMAKSLGLILHQKKLDPQKIKGNLEASCREERLKFFASLCQKHGYQAVLLAHHADDLAETVLKRTLEGVTLPYLTSLRFETTLYGMKVWRPLLSLSKRQILDWLHKKGLKGFDDQTNQNTKFLRAKFRQNILPYLSEMFGKEINSGLCQIAEEAGELRDYLDDRIQRYLDSLVQGQSGYFLDLSHDFPKDLFELKYLIRQFCKHSAVVLSRESVIKTAEFILQKSANKTFVLGKGELAQILYIDRGRLFIPLKRLSSLPNIRMRIEESHPIQFGEWKVQMKPYDKSPSEPSNWRNLWQEGKGEVVLPKGFYEVASPVSSLNKWWSDHKIPAFFRKKIPIILENGKVRHEFLTGKIGGVNQTIDGEGILLSIAREKVSG